MQLNACAVAGRPLRGALAANVAKWSLKSAPLSAEKFLKPPPPADPKNWLDARVGWALIAFERDGFNAQQYADNQDLCAPLRKLLDKRENTLVLRFRPDADQRFTLLRDYRNGRQVDIAGAPVGKAVGSLPRYLLLAGKPTRQQLPWALQYLLSVNRYVGRLPFDPLHDEALLSPYIQSCLNDWADAQCDTAATLTWAVDHDPEDITHVMRRSIADAVHEKFAADEDLKDRSVRLASDQAAQEELQNQLSVASPAMIVTTSHGMTGPLDDPDAMAARLGLPVDCQYQPLVLDSLLKTWNPSGAIWYAHACCAAGSDDGSRFDSLLEAGSDAQQTLTAVGKLGARAAPLPLALLSAAKPARAFVGHVEPTFDWTLKQPATGQLLTSSLIGALYDELYLGSPIGHAFRGWYAAAGTHYAAWDATKQAFDGKATTTASLLYHNLVARDIQTLVLLGDPVVKIGKDPPQGA